MVTRTAQALLEAVQQSTTAVQRLVEQMPTIQLQTARNSVTAGRRSSGGRARIAAGYVENLAT